MSESSTQTPKNASQSVRYQPLVIVLVAVCAGIVADRLLGLPVAIWWTSCGIAWGLWIVFRRQGRDRVAAVVLLVSVAACAGAWHHLRWFRFRDDDLGSYTQLAPRPACVEAVVLKGPRRIPAPEFDPMRIIPVGDRTRLEVQISAIRDGTDWRKATGQSSLTVDGHLLGVRAGDRLKVFGQLASPRPADNPGEFDAAAHARSDRRLSQLSADYPDCVTVVGRGRWAGFRRLIDSTRSSGERLLRRYIQDSRAGLAAAVLLGAREEIGQQRFESFTETGTVHLLAISGLHVGIVAWTLFWGLRLLLVSQSRAAVIVAAAAVFYTVLTDARPPAIRAAILVLVTCGSIYLGRPRLGFNSLAAAGLVVLAMNPADLFRTGPQLSFVAVMGLMWFAPWWFGSADEQDKLERVWFQSLGWPSRKAWIAWQSLQRLALISLVIWLLTLPLVMARFNLIAPVAVVLNTILWLPMMIALATGFGVLALGWLLPPVASLLGWVCDGSLWLLELCIQTAREIPCSHYWVPGPANWWLVGFYGGLGVLAAFPRIRPPRCWLLALLAGWVAIGFAASWAGRRPDRLQCTFVSAGHGLTVLLELPSGQTMLYDAGQMTSPQYGARTVAAFLWSKGITHLDAVVLSHSDADHYNMLPGLLDRFSVGVVYVSPVMFEAENAAMLALGEAIEQAGIPVRQIRAGDRLSGGDDCLIEVLHPTRRGLPGRDNVNSVVLSVEYLKHRILLPGDLEARGLDAVMAEEPWDCDLLLAPHHGSRGSDPPGLSAWCTPDWVVISGSLSSLQPDTADAYRDAGAEVLHTGSVGAVQVAIDDNGLDVDGFLDSSQ